MPFARTNDLPLHERLTACVRACLTRPTKRFRFGSFPTGGTMSDKLIPADAQVAAKRGFIRTTAQAYGTALAGGITVAAVSDAFAQATSGNPAPLIIAAAVTVVSPLIAGAASYFSILANGIPADYKTLAG